MPNDDLQYCERRAEIERERANAATNPAVIAAHHELSVLYSRRAEKVRAAGWRTKSAFKASDPNF